MKVNIAYQRNEDQALIEKVVNAILNADRSGKVKREKDRGQEFLHVYLTFPVDESPRIDTGHIERRKEYHDKGK